MPVKRCVHCLEYSKDITWDHVLPRAWYPSTTPQNIGRWKIPACSKCNKEYGQLEEDLLIRIGLCLDPKDPACLGIPQKALRAVSPQFAKNPKDRACRQRRYEKLMRESLSGDNVPTQGIYPNLGNIAPTLHSSLLAFIIPAESIKRLNEKIIRGITFINDGCYIEKSMHIEFWAVDDVSAQPVVDLIAQHGKKYSVGPGIIVYRAMVPQDGSALFFINIWNRFKMYGYVGDAWRS